MITELKEWVQDTIKDLNYSRKTADIAAQILGYIRKGYYAPTLHGCKLEFPDGADINDPGVFGELVFENADGYSKADGSIKPHDYVTGNVLDESTAVYVTGLLIYYMITATEPEFSIFMMAKESGAMLSLPDSELDEAVRAMTEIDPKKRIGSDDALKMLAERFPADAELIFIEKESGAEIGTQRLSLGEAVVVWECGASRREFHSMPFGFCEDRIELPYRAAGIRRLVTISFFRDKFNGNGEPGVGGKYIGVDIGSSGTHIVAIDNGKVYSIAYNGEYTIPTAVEHNGEKYFFLTDTDDRIFLRQADGTTTEMSRMSMAESFMKKISAICGEDADGVCFTYSDSFSRLLDKALETVFGEKKIREISHQSRQWRPRFLMRTSLREISSQRI